MAAEAKGYGYHEAPRARCATGCHQGPEDRELSVRSPGGINASPEMPRDREAPMKSLMGTPIADPNRPIEIQRL